MKVFFVFTVLAFGYVFSLWKYGGMEKVVLAKLDEMYEFEKKTYELTNESNALKVQVSDLQYQISQLESKNKFLTAQVGNSKVVSQTRSIASVPQVSTEDLVNFDVYKWTPEKLLAIGEKELHYKNYEKSSQFYKELIERYPQHQVVNDKALFGAGVAAFETGKNYELSEKYLGKLVKEYPESSFYRNAKLWLALSQYQQGEHKRFLETVEEFRLKYRNTDEWKILSRYYEDINYKIKK